MKPTKIIIIWIFLSAALGLIAVAVWRVGGHGVNQLTGVVLIENSDSSKQTAIAGAEVIAQTDTLTAHAVSDESGLFHLEFTRRVPSVNPVDIHITHPKYRPVSIQQPMSENVFVIRLQPLTSEEVRTGQNPIEIRDIRIRYSAKATRTLNIASFEKTFEVQNRGHIPCNQEEPCSPDGKWKAARSIETFDAGEHNEFQNTRLSCIAGPCPFTNRSMTSSENGRKLIASVLNWSDPTTFLLEAEVSQTRETEVIQDSFPAIFGNTLSFTLPRYSEGPTIEAAEQGRDIVFVLGPDLILSWATCSRTLTQDGNRLIRCEAKPGYVVLQ